MSLFDIFKARKSSQLNKLVWSAIWARVKNPPEVDAEIGELYLVYVGTLQYATCYQAALAAGMQDGVAKTVAMQVVGKSGYDKPLEDRLLTVFSLAADNPTASYAVAVNAEVARLVAAAKATGAAPQSEEIEPLLGLFALLCEQLHGCVER